MLKRSFPFILATIGIISAILLVGRSNAAPPVIPPAALPASNPYLYAVAAAGIVEGASENHAIGAPIDALVEKIFVKVWEPVEAGTPLFRLDTREIASQVEVDRAEYEVAKAKLARLEDQLERLASIQDARAISVDLLKTKQNDVYVAEKEVERAACALRLQETLLQRMTVVAPCKGTVIQKNIKEGEYLSLTPKEPAFLIGDTTALQIRADIDEQNAHEVISGAPAVAYPKNNPSYSIPLEFVRIEPYVMPKKSLTGTSDERVDTRVLQVIYRFDPPQDFRLYIGQQVDVFIEASPRIERKL